MTRGTGRHLLATSLRSLKVRNFRLFAVGQIASATGTWMMAVAQDWLVLELTDDSGGALAIVTALQFTPVLLLTLYGGRLADRYDKRALLTGANIASGVFALALGLMVTADAARLWHIYVAAAALGVANAVEVPARLSFITELVGPELLPNASAARLVAAWGCAFGALELITGWAPNLPVALALLVPTGFASLYFVQAANHRIQLGGDPAHRGRVMALYTVILQGSTPLGALFVGTATHTLGARSGLWAGGLIALTAALVALAGARADAPVPAPEHEQARPTGSRP